MTILTGHLADLTSGRAPNAKLIIDGPPIKFPAGRTLYTGGRTIPFDHLGNIVATLVPTDTAGTDPETWQYQFTIVWDGGSLLPFSAEITGDTVDLIDLQPLNPADPVYIPTAVAIERVTGLAELLDDLGEATTGKATAAELTAETTARKAADATKANRPGAAWSLTADGAPYKTGTTNNQTRKTPTGTGTSQIVIHVDGLPAGDHAMILTHTGTSGQFLYLDCILRESPTPPTIVLVKFAGVTSTGYAVFPGSGPALVPIYDAIVDAVAAKFPADGSVIVMDPKAAGFDPAQHTGADGTHAHDAGAQIIAAQLADVVNGLPARNGLVRL